MYLKVFDVKKNTFYFFYRVGDVKFSWEKHRSDGGKQSHRGNESGLERLANRFKDPNCAHYLSQTFFTYIMSSLKVVKIKRAPNNDNKHEGISHRCPNCSPATDFR